MNTTSKELDQRLFLGSLVVLALESNPLELNILSEMLVGFRIRSLARFMDAAAACTHLDRETPDLLFVGSAAGPMDEYEFIRHLRKSQDETVRTTPVILLSGHTQQANVFRARDCGASFVVAKPVVPKVLYARIVWLARDRRAFVEGKSYIGPDRRFHDLGPPEGTDGRRSTDLAAAGAAAAGRPKSGAAAAMPTP